MRSVEDLQPYLSAAGLAIQELPDNTSTAPLAAKALHTAVVLSLNRCSFMRTKSRCWYWWRVIAR